MKERSIRTEHRTTELGGVCGSFRNRQDGDSLLIFFQMDPLFSAQVEVVKVMVMIMVIVMMMVMVVMRRRRMVLVLVIRRRRKW